MTFMSDKVIRAAIAGVAFAATLFIGNVEADSPHKIVGLRRLTETQYRNSVADIFGPDITVAGIFAPIVRPDHQLLATGASDASLSPTGLEQFDNMARGIAGQVFDEGHRASFMACKPKQPTKPDGACASRTLGPIGRYVFRRPLTAQELAIYTQMADRGAAKSGSFYTGMELALGAMLVSPNFLYIVETAEPNPAHPGHLRLDNYSRASRLSYTLWDTTPDDALLKSAARGELTDQAKLDAIASKMVGSPRLADGVRAFFSDMLMFENFDDLAKDPVIFPRFNQTVAKALPEQMLRMVVDVLVTRNEDYRDIFTTRRTFMTRALGTVYDVPVEAEKGWEPYEFSADSGRAGLFSEAGFLSIYAHSGRSSATRRGRAIRELLLCQPVPNPPGNVNFAVVQDTSNKAFPTARDRLMAHTNDPVCSACHKITDPIGLSLENFDGIGAYRSHENGALIDASGIFEKVKFDGAEGLGEALARTPSSTECAASRAYEYATGRPVNDDALTIALEKDFAAGNYRIGALFKKIVTMPRAYEVPSESNQTSAGDTQHASLEGGLK